MQKPLAIAISLGVTGFLLIVLLLVFSPPETIKPAEKKVEQLTEEQYISQHLKSMSQEDKVRQLFMWTVTGPNVSDEQLKQIEALKPAGVMISGSMNHTELLMLTVRIRALKTTEPLIISIDQEGGQVRRFTDDPLGNPREMSVIDDETFCDNIKDSSRWLSELGVNLNFGIIADIAWTPESVMYERSYGSDPGTVSRHVAEAIQCTSGVKTTVKHFPGHGRSQIDSHYAIPSIPLTYDDWKKTDAVPFKAAIQNNIDAVMMGHLIFPDISSDPASLSPRFIKEVRDLGFEGIVITDDLGMLEAAGLNPVDSMKKAIVAGNDILLYANTTALPEDLSQQAIDFVKQKGISDAELDARVTKILKMKFHL
jgi:beta-N-acetylhexosaminidase